MRSCTEVAMDQIDIFVHINSEQAKVPTVLVFDFYKIQKYIPILVVFVNEFMSTKMSHLVHHKTYPLLHVG